MKKNRVRKSRDTASLISNWATITRPEPLSILRRPFSLPMSYMDIKLNYVFNIFSSTVQPFDRYAEILKLLLKEEHIL